MLSARGSIYGGRRSSFGGYSSGGGYDLGGVWRPHTGRNEIVFDKGDYIYDGMGVQPYGFYGNNYDPALLGDYYRSPVDYYGAYNSLAMYEEQLRRMHDISEAERLARWQARLQFEELCEEKRAVRYSLMAEEERMRLGLMGGSHWASRYSDGYGPYDYDSHAYYPSQVSCWNSSRLPLSSSLAARFGPLYGGTGYRGAGSQYGSAYGAMGGYMPSYGRAIRSRTGSVASNIMCAQVDEARRLRRHAREYARQARRGMICY